METMIDEDCIESLYGAIMHKQGDSNIKITLIFNKGKNRGELVTIDWAPVRRGFSSDEEAASGLITLQNIFLKSVNSILTKWKDLENPEPPLPEGIDSALYYNPWYESGPHLSWARAQSQNRVELLNTKTPQAIAKEEDINRLHKIQSILLAEAENSLIKSIGPTKKSYNQWIDSYKEKMLMHVVKNSNFLLSIDQEKRKECMNEFLGFFTKEGLNKSPALAPHHFQPGWATMTA